MLETEVESLVAGVFRCCKVGQTLLFGHRCPFFVPAAVAKHVVYFRQKVQHNIHAENG